jgi:2-methylcitrate dehydratase PrpD
MSTAITTSPLSSMISAIAGRPRVALKPYPVCHWIHAPVDAAVAAAAGAAPEQIERIVVRIPQAGVPIVLEPAPSKWRPQTAYDAKFALPWCVATRLVHGRLDVETFAGAELADSTVLALADRIEAAPWTGPPSGSPFAGAAEVTANGVTRLARLESPRGSGDTPLAVDEVRAKFRANARLLVGEPDVEAVIDAIEGLAVSVPLSALAAAMSAGVEVRAPS